MDQEVYTKDWLIIRMRELGFSEETIEMVFEGDEPGTAITLIEMAEAYLDGINPFSPEHDYPLPNFVEHWLNEAMKD